MQMLSVHKQKLKTEVLLKQTKETITLSKACSRIRRIMQIRLSGKHPPLGSAYYPKPEFNEHFIIH